MRADLAVANALKISRNKATELIKGGEISIDGEIIKKTSQNISESAKILAPSEIFVSRGAIKLAGFLDDLKRAGIFIDFNAHALDIGASSGGFTQILLKNGAKSVTALENGNGQLSEILRKDERVKMLENTDIRGFCGGPFEIITADVSFISLTQILKDIDRLANRDIITLFKPQFEVGKDVKRNQKGVVIDKIAIKMATENFEKTASKFWELKFSKECVISGKEGNFERFYYFKK